ncbi:hypothetical protein GEV33_005763 [Tenebrio molitor]|uniref:Ankyrin repeat protein n=1 Tax=Tenebrio molitor TaxID=7067 RepID=A0A8J6LF29_TENMO|nr:hypothetical protein GEV33_005763 [Tenebrio molitor]
MIVAKYGNYRQKKYLLIASVVQNKIAILRKHLNSVKWYKTVFRRGSNLLQIAIICGRREIFDYLLTIPNFPLDLGIQKALDRAPSNSSDELHEYFILELIKKGADINNSRFDEDTVLHFVIENSFLKLAKYLMEKGFDVNKPDKSGQTPLWLALEMETLTAINRTELVTALLCYGADPEIRCEKQTYSAFEFSVISNCEYELQEALFRYSFDEFSPPQLNMEVIVMLATWQSPIFEEVVESVEEIITAETPNKYFYMFFNIGTVYMKALVEKRPDILREIIAAIEYKIYADAFYYFVKIISIENLNVMMESTLRDDIITCIHSVKFTSRVYAVDPANEVNHSTLIQFMCYLLSYGFLIDVHDLQMVYQKFGFCELFRIMLHMDRQKYYFNLRWKKVMPSMYYNMRLNLPRFLKRYSRFSDSNNIHHLLNYFAHPELKKICSSLHSPRVDEKIKSDDSIDLNLATYPKIGATIIADAPRCSTGLNEIRPTLAIPGAASQRDLDVSSQNGP